MGRLAKVWGRVKAATEAQNTVNVDLQLQVAQAQQNAPDADDTAALAEMEAAYPEPPAEKPA